MGNAFKELVGTSPENIILSILTQGDNYGYEIVQKVKTLSNGQVNWHETSIYPALKKMEKLQFIKSYWIVEEKERPRKYYKLLSAGLAELEAEKKDWNQVQLLLTRL